MDIKRLSPQNLFMRFVATFLVILVMRTGGFVNVQLSLASLFLFSLAEVFIFSILMMIFYMIMVQYLMKKSKLALAEALICRYGHWPISLICFGTMNLIFKLSWSGLVILMIWLASELTVYIAQTLFGPKRRNDHGR